MKMINNRLMTLGELAKFFNVPEHVVEYAIRRCRVEPTQRAGILRLWDSDGRREVEEALRQIRRPR